MKTYLVGGALRDRLLGRPVSDHDWLVVGATPEEMAARGYLPVGRDFPVFLHPQTREEYALARTERKSAPGYRGFTVHASPDVTLEQDLARRDLTVNAIALPAEFVDADGRFEPDADKLADPFHGRRDLEQKLLRHVTDAFREDPVRILRVARFAARFDDFSVAPETMALMREMVEAGEADALVPERVWQELSRGLMETRPSRMFEVLRACGALAVLLPEVDRLWGVPQPEAHHPEVDSGLHLMMVIDTSARLEASLPVRFACLMHDLGKGTTEPGLLPRHIGHEKRSAELLHAVCDRWRVPVEIRELAEVVAREHGNIHRSGELTAAALVRLLERCDAFRKPARFADVLLACECDARGRLGFEERPYPQRERLLAVLATAAGVPTDAVARAAQQSGAAGPQIGEAIHRARVEAVAASLG
ncbi:multifunctional CCA addition/repair protein [Variovorax beijingensis]|uniref:Multifunctional CCA protein n=1 Tax=Variovorax beijingensis TaxID=2496117 RepID=A0A3P3EIR5_9BURK|nr:multifunctional CCA addition/repair protein [Variovorax beijingensis]RRH86280.1 multifunctional CCA addition/repair protein [Variovorax beijingensis]RSZ33991.1 multifunctional CCA addition/repair protein [Variovorax beijingensis]